MSETLTHSVDDWMSFLQGCYRLMTVANSEGVRAVVKLVEPSEIGERYFPDLNQRAVSRPIALLEGMLGGINQDDNVLREMGRLASAERVRLRTPDGIMCLALGYLAGCVRAQKDALVAVREMRYLIPRSERPSLKTLETWVKSYGDRVHQRSIDVPGATTSERLKKILIASVADSLGEESLNVSLTTQRRYYADKN